MSATCFINTCTMKHLLSHSLLRVAVGLLESKIVFHYYHISFANTDMRKRPMTVSPSMHMIYCL